MSSSPHIFFITGASGVGKTTLVSQLEEKYHDRNDWAFLHFDSIGVPSKEEMEEQYGSGENWQKEMTKTWVQKMLSEYPDKRTIIFEGQVNLDFIREGFEQSGFSDYTTVLIDCNEEMMHHRLSTERMQPELVTPEMNNWRRLLREQAQKYGESIIDTHELDKEQAIEAFEVLLKREGVTL